MSAVSNGRSALRATLCLLGLHAAMAALTRPPSLALDCVPSNVPSSSSKLFPAAFHITSRTPSSTMSASVKVTLAEQFVVEYFDDYKVVTLLHKSNESYVLYQCGGTQPADISPATYPNGSKFFEIPLHAVTVADTTVLGFMDLLGVLDRVAYASSYSSQPCMQKLASTAAPGCNRNDSTSTNITTDAMFMYESNSTNPQSVAFTATSDIGVLERAEWIKFVSVFFNKELEANARFNGIQSTYSELQQKVTNSQTPAATRKRVAWMSMVPAEYSGYKYVEIYLKAFKLQYVRDAGGLVLDSLTIMQQYPNSSSVYWNSKQFDDDEIHVNFTASETEAIAALRNILQYVDVVIDETFSFTYGVGSDDVTFDMFLELFGLNTTEAANLPFVNDRAVYRLEGVTSESGGTDWFETAVARPDLALADFVKALSPAVPTEGAARWLRPIGDNSTVLRAADCTGLLANCALTAEPICPFVQWDCSRTQLVEATPEGSRCGLQCPPPSAPAPPPPGNAAQPLATTAAVLLLVAVVLLALH